MRTNAQSNTLPQSLEAARAGDLGGLIDFLYPVCRARALRLVLGFQEAYGARLDVDDVTQEGMEQVLRSLAGALACDHPIARLLTAVQGRMLHYCQEQRGPVRVPHESQRRGARVPRVLSLDAPLVADEDFTLLDRLAAGAWHV